ncbi:unnamed protein product [Phytomonas sp. Hart1]|nr:unnamed protein product [Phytomonas sp. Hart1]|eukprot:CCW66222.1 unnamed protein product [Phytomonas sp. isolate Hart1]
MPYLLSLPKRSGVGATSLPIPSPPLSVLTAPYLRLNSSSWGVHTGVGKDAGALYSTRRGIRTVIAPRPAVTTLVYLNNMGTRIRDGTETNISLIRTRDNQFYIQRILPDGEVVRWYAPGLEHLKHVTNFDTYSLNVIDENGGIVIPSDVVPSPPSESAYYLDAIYYINQIQAVRKFTRKDRRRWHRKLFMHWKESPEKFVNHTIGTYGMASLVILWVLIRGFHSLKNKKSFWDADVYNSHGRTETERQKKDPWLKIKRFSDCHPEHEGMDLTVAMFSPGQSRLSSARAELRESDFTDPHYHSEFWWKVRHCRYYGHWPKGIAE